MFDARTGHVLHTVCATVRRQVRTRILAFMRETGTSLESLYSMVLLPAGVVNEFVMVDHGASRLTNSIEDHDDS